MRFLLGLVFALSPLAAHAATFPFGLDALRWHMTPDTASGAFAPLKVHGKRISGDPLPFVMLDGYVWRTCRLGIAFNFDTGGLSMITLDVRSGGAACDKAAVAEMFAHYGAARPAFNLPWHRIWRTPDTEASYSRTWRSNIFEITLRRSER
jgi:hypothetical protein